MAALSAEAYREAIRTVGLTQASASRFFFASERAGRYWAAGGCPPLIATILEYMIENDVTPDDFRPGWNNGAVVRRSET